MCRTRWTHGQVDRTPHGFAGGNRREKAAQYPAPFTGDGEHPGDGSAPRPVWMGGPQHQGGDQAGGPQTLNVFDTVAIADVERQRLCCQLSKEGKRHAFLKKVGRDLQ